MSSCWKGGAKTRAKRRLLLVLDRAGGGASQSLSVTSSIGSPIIVLASFVHPTPSEANR